MFDTLSPQTKLVGMGGAAEPKGGLIPAASAACLYPTDNQEETSFPKGS